MIASLAMYDWPETATANDAFWALIHRQLRDRGLEAPRCLTRDGDLWAIWQDPSLVLAQTCGMPYRTRLKDHVLLVGTPDHALPGAPPGYYYSQLVARREDTGPLEAFRDGRLAYNDDLSQSGWAAVQSHAARSGFAFTNLHRTGAHRDSAAAVAEGRADLASIDAVTWRLIERYRPDIAARLHVVARTEPTPGLPLITALGRDPAPLAAAIAAAIAELPAKHRTVLGIERLIHIPKEAYLAVANPPPLRHAPD